MLDESEGQTCPQGDSGFAKVAILMKSVWTEERGSIFPVRKQSDGRVKQLANNILRVNP